MEIHENAFLIFLVACFFLAPCLAKPKDMSTALLIKVDQSGEGDFKTIQEAIDSVASDNTELVFISVKHGIYREKVVVPEDKPFITISGTKAIETNHTIITWDDSGDIFQSPTFSVLASDFVGRYITIQNTYGPGIQAVALRVSGDKAAFYGCRITSHQDTLLDDTGRHYYSKCYIEGATDFICGNAASLYKKCHLHSISEEAGAITAQRRESPSEHTGFIFMGGKVTGTRGAVLGRPWGDYSTVVFALTYLSNAVLPEGWDDWRDSSKHNTVYYGEYKCFGPGAVGSRRVNWAHNFSAEEIEPLLSKFMMGCKEWIRPVPTHFRRRTQLYSVEPYSLRMK